MYMIVGGFSAFHRVVIDSWWNGGQEREGAITSVHDITVRIDRNKAPCWLWACGRTGMYRYIYNIYI